MRNALLFRKELRSLLADRAGSNTTAKYSRMEYRPFCLRNARAVCVTVVLTAGLS